MDLYPSAGHSLYCFLLSTYSFRLIDPVLSLTIGARGAFLLWEYRRLVTLKMDILVSFRAEGLPTSEQHNKNSLY